MLEQAEREPTIQEIVLALRETTQGMGQAPSLDSVGAQRASRPPPNAVSRETAARPARHYEIRDDNQDETTGAINTADLRDREIDRLLAENARLNERVMFLLKVIEDERARNATPAAAGDRAIETDRGAISREVRRGIEAELRPVLLAVLRLLEKHQTSPADPTADAGPALDVAPAPPGKRAPLRTRSAATPPAARMAAPSKWLSDLIQNLDSAGEAGTRGEAAAKIGALPS